MSSWNRQVSALGCFHQSGRLLIIRLLIPRPGAHRSVYAVQNYGFDLFCSLDKVSLTIQAFLWITIQALLSGPLKLFKVQVLSCFQWNQMSSFTYRSIVGCAFGHTSIVAFLPPPSSPSTEGPTGTWYPPATQIFFRYPTRFSFDNHRLSGPEILNQYTAERRDVLENTPPDVNPPANWRKKN